MEDLLIETLDNLGYPIIRQGSLSPDERYPDHFFTFWNSESDGAMFYDNEENRTDWFYTLCFYSIDPLLTYSKLLEAKKLLKHANFIVTGKGYDVASDEPTHTGRGIDIIFMEV